MIVIFLGPSLEIADARAELDAIYRGPVSQGDVYRASLDAPSVIGIVDGYFDHVPSVWHKEILWALSQGIHVYGAASMGALRAAELHAFGMIGVGSIFEQYRDGLLEDDDEVAVVHGPRELSYRPMSESMVNVRATLKAAERAGAIAASSEEALVPVAKGLFYPRRSWPAILQHANDTLPSDEIAALRAWLPAGRVDQKRLDALAMLRLIAAQHHATAPAPRQRQHFVFEHTVFWQRLIDEAGVATATGELVVTQAVIDELWLQPDRYLDLQAVVEQSGLPMSGRRSDTRRRLVEAAKSHEIYDELAARALAKQSTLAAAGLTDFGEADEAAQGEALLTWYLDQCDRPGWREEAFLPLAWANWQEFLRAVVREQCYREIKSAGNR